MYNKPRGGRGRPADHTLSALGRRVIGLSLLYNLGEVLEPEHALLLALSRHLARYPVPPLLASLGELRQRGLERNLQNHFSSIKGFSGLFLRLMTRLQLQEVWYNLFCQLACCCWLHSSVADASADSVASFSTFPNLPPFVFFFSLTETGGT